MFEFEDCIKFTVGEVVPAREGLRHRLLFAVPEAIVLSERLFQLEKD